MVNMRLKTDDLLNLVRRVNNFPWDANSKSIYRPFIVHGHTVGLISPEVAADLAKYPHVFIVIDTEVTFNNRLQTYGERSDALRQVLKELRSQERHPTLSGWRDECYQIEATYGSGPLFEIERAAAPMFGLRKYGIQVTGFVRGEDGEETCVWVQRRSPTKQTYPGKLDNFVSGGLTEGRGVLETAIKEAHEEAGISPQLAKGLVACGTVSYLHKSDRGIHPQTEFVFELELGDQFQPCNMDGEVSEWVRVPASQLTDVISSEDFKVTSVPAALDFLIRHGHLSVEDEPNLPKLTEMLHVPVHSLFD